MDAKQMIVVVLLITFLGLGWQAFLLHEYAVHPNWIRPNQQAVQSAPGAPSQGPSAPTSQQASTAPSTAPATAGAWQLIPPTASVAAVSHIGSEKFNDAKYHIGLAISSQGAGIEDVTLNQYLQEADSPELFTFQDPYADQVAQTRSLGTTAIVIDGVTVPTADQSWGVSAQDDHSITYAARFQGPGAQSTVEVDKQYAVLPVQNSSSTDQGYEVLLTYSVKNLSPAAHSVSIQFNGPTMPRAETARQETETVAGYDDDGVIHIEHQPLSSYTSSKPNKNYAVEADNLPLRWVGASSNYFNAIVRPEVTGKIAGALSLALNPDSPAISRLIVIHLSTVNFDISPGGQAQLPMRVFFGPKRRGLLGSPYYASFPLSYNDTLVMVANWFCGLCTFPWLISILVTLLSWIHFFLFDWGLAIIALVCLVRLILHPITKRSQVSMMKMQKLAPEMERLKKKFGDDKEGFQRAQMDLYKNVGFTPMLGCLPMFLQMPIFIALWRSLQTTFELRQAPFLEFFGYHLTWIHDLSRPDALYTFAHPLPLPFGWQLATINVLPLAMAIVSFINTKYFVPKPAAMSPEQEQQQKMMTWMTLIFPFMFYTFPSGLNLYYLTTTSVGIIESKRIRAHIKQQQDAEAATGPIIVDAGKRAVRRRAELVQPAAPKKKGYWATVMENAQKRADEIARETKKKNKPRD